MLKHNKERSRPKTVPCGIILNPRCGPTLTLCTLSHRKFSSQVSIGLLNLQKKNCFYIKFYCETVSNAFAMFIYGTSKVNCVSTIYVHCFVLPNNLVVVERFERKPCYADVMRMLCWCFTLVYCSLTPGKITTDISSGTIYSWKLHPVLFTPELSPGLFSPGLFSPPD